MSTELARIAPEEPVALPPGYYERRSDPDQLVYLLGPSGVADVRYVSGERTMTWSAHDFALTYRAAPDGLARRTAEMARLMAEVAAAAENTDTADLAAYNPHVGVGGAAEGMALVPTGSENPEAAKRSIAEIRNAAGRARNEMAAKSAAIKAFAEEQAVILRARADELAAVLEKAEEAIWSINLYLGTKEEIVRLTEGAPAAPDTPITVRQLVLFMDEETMAAAEQGGMDHRDIDWFDEWVVDPVHLAQVLPEARGIVALKPRRSRKDYGDPWTDMAHNKENRRTYFLIRNGGLLYRMWTDYQVEDHLVPRTDEFLRVFHDRVMNWETHEYEDVILEPGSDAYMKAEKGADKQRRHYMRAALVLQGLIDRTTVFQPLKWPRVNVNSAEAYDEAINLVLDADQMLGDGRERFADWLRRVNADLDLGSRVVGTWGNYEHGLRTNNDREYGNSRLSPRHADLPAPDALYTLDDRRDGGLVFKYPRTDWRGDPVRRASCVVYPTDKFILNFDAATEDEMRFYLESRADRREYLYMYPLLRYALDQKAAEREAEAPFRLLLAGQIAQRHRVDLEAASAAVPGLVDWWKFKNRTHRALTANDTLALRMIVDEYGRRGVNLSRRPEEPQVLAAMRAAHPDALLLAHKAGSEFVALVPANDENIYVHEEVWSARGRKQRREWRTVDKRYLRWSVLYTSDRWAEWKVGAGPREHLTDPERAAFVTAGWDALDKKMMQTWRKGKVPERLAAAWRDGKLELFYWDGPVDLPADLLLSNNVRPDTYIGLASIAWRRVGQRVAVGTIDDGRVVPGKDGKPWLTGWHGPYTGKVVWEDPEAAARWRRFVAAVKRYSEAVSALENIVYKARESVRAQALAAWEAEQYAAFLADYGDPDLWEGHRKTLKPPQPDVHALTPLFRYLVERGVSLEGRLVRNMASYATDVLGWAGAAPSEWLDYEVRT